ncbi:iron-sulfur cluster biosynthesis family protein [Paenibacillus silviterrae]|uniref:iron-sulfur cluster biosynthesis family protein n=1 Tax=Paenibacillus silviterrae TaxID=3242194 RepID=UPI0025428FEB|nr:iron-sulfur cluster biosynthesis family protein [Paenibacillus chinjuensis]
MRINFTEQAAARISGFLSLTESGVLKLAYDSEGCGCAVSGVPTLWLVDEPGPNDFRLENEEFELWMDRKHEVFFEELMTVDLQPNGIAFVLKSTGQIYTASMRLIDKRSHVTA